MRIDVSGLYWRSGRLAPASALLGRTCEPLDVGGRPKSHSEEMFCLRINFHTVLHMDIMREKFPFPDTKMGPGA